MSDADDLKLARQMDGFFQRAREADDTGVLAGGITPAGLVEVFARRIKHVKKEIPRKRVIGELRAELEHKREEHKNFQRALMEDRPMTMAQVPSPRDHEEALGREVAELEKELKDAEAAQAPDEGRGSRARAAGDQPASGEAGGRAGGRAGTTGRSDRSA